MAAFPTYRLTFRSPLHIGERGVGLEATHTHVPADTLFSAICSVWREVYGVEKLYIDVLDWFSEGEEGNEPFLLTSAFPFAGPVRFFPKPLVHLGRPTLDQNDEKTFKRVRFVSEGIFTDIVTGKALTFAEGKRINGGTVWVTQSDHQALSNWTDDETGDIVLWKTSVVPRVSLDRITSASEIWHFGETRFVTGAGLWFAVDFNPEHGDALRRGFLTVLRVLGDTGLGGERGAGRGLFEVDAPQDEPLPEPDHPARFVTLSPLCPKGTQLASLTRTGAAYELIPRRGWVTSPEASNLRRKAVWMFAEGSVLMGEPVSPLGGLVNVKPDVCPHDVWRYGFAFPVGMRTS
ncbi:CRISPR system Cms protein Csm4 [Candidatus Entotheonellaceae bacterium PAL068K]